MSGKHPRPDELSSKSSAAQLWARVVELSDELKRSEPEQVRQMSDELERARADTRDLVDELRAARATPVRGVAGVKVAGKPALSDFRKETWTEFTFAVGRLPGLRARYGMGFVRMEVARTLLPDLYLLGLAPPRGPIEARERDTLRRCLDSTPFLALLTRPEPWADRLRALFISRVARSYYRSSVYTAYETATSEEKLDKLGTVYK